jgi:cytochrome c551/c552
VIPNVVRILLPVLPVIVLAHALSTPLAAQDPQAARAVLDQYCVTCHNQRANTAGLALDTTNFDEVAEDAETWEKVIRKIEAGMMPPVNAPRPERAVLDNLRLDLETRLDQAAALEPDPDAPLLHRLNRTEYANAIRDLLALGVDVTTLLPADDSSEGFDNIADSLTVSPSLVQGYLSAAMKISRLAVGDMTMLPYRVDYPAPQNLIQDEHLEGLPLGTLGGIVVEHTFPLDGEYEVTASGSSELLIDGVAPPPPPEPAGGRGGRGAFGGRGGRGRRLTFSAGPHTIAAAVIERSRSGGVDGIYQAPVTGRGVTSISINGPFDPTGPGKTPSRERIFVCYPEAADEELSCAREVLTTLATRAFRRPASDEEVGQILRSYELGRAEQPTSNFETGIQHGLARILVSPNFFYRFEQEPADADVGQAYPIDDLELASRLSFFLWSSIPDDELRDVAVRGDLSDTATFRQQVMRMLADPKADALVDNFASQWLALRELAQVTPEAGDFDDNLRRSFTRETRQLFEEILREDLSVVTLLDPDYTFVDERLAEHYGIPEIRGSYFRRVELSEDSPRRGIVGHGSILTATSIPTRTSPVVRGKWILENILGVPAPEPPPGVETDLEPEAGVTEASSLRQRLEAHRANPVCSSCHQIMDPIGLALENFDLTGQWREFDEGVPIDASGVLVDGTPVDGPADLRRALVGRSEVFVKTMTEKMLMYALGRPVEYHDMPTVRSIVRGAREEDYRLSSIVLGVAESLPFRMRVKSAPGPGSEPEAGE